MSAFKLFMVANLYFNWDVNTKWPVILSHQCSTTASLETYPLLLHCSEDEWTLDLHNSKVVHF